MTKTDIYNMLKGLKEDDGATLLDWMPVQYKTGYQVATRGAEFKSARKAAEYMHKEGGGDFGIWYSKGVYYIDESYHIDDIQTAMAIGRACNQQSILDWHDMSLIWL